ncbi:MAG TPA: aldehyde dehydrogenase family protein [Accumulibacter sp.]|nr:aldehyde dehydrogenase family protein [Accumulibacter sp.]
MSRTEEIRAIPLWINGRAYLTMAASFVDVCHAASGEILRRTPLCGSLEAQAAFASAEQALPVWSTLTLADRSDLLLALAEALAAYTEHFAGLISAESGLPAHAAAAEIAAAVSLLKQSSSDDAAEGVVAILGDRQQPFLSLLRHAVPALLAGSTVILKPSPHTPSVLFALAELSARCAFPSGVINVLHGDLAAIEGLFAIAALRRLYFVGEPAAAVRVAAIAERYGKTLIA